MDVLTRAKLDCRVPELRSIEDQRLDLLRSLRGTGQSLLGIWARQKIPPSPGKIRYLGNCSKFFRQIYTAYRGFRPHVVQISLQHLLAFKSYNYLNLSVHFSK